MRNSLKYIKIKECFYLCYSRENSQLLLKSVISELTFLRHIYRKSWNQLILPQIIIRESYQKQGFKIARFSCLG